MIERGVVGISSGGWQDEKIVSVQWQLIARFRYCGHDEFQTQSVFPSGRRRVEKNFMGWGEKNLLACGAFFFSCYVLSRVYYKLHRFKRS